MIFSDKTKAKAIKSLNEELAWKREDVFAAINELSDNGYAILGGDVWALTTKQVGQYPLTYIDPTHVVVGIIKGQDGVDYVFNWHSEKGGSESWNEFVKRSKEETIASVANLNAEATVADEFKSNIYYNLVYVDKFEFKNLR